MWNWISSFSPRSNARRCASERIRDQVSAIQGMAPSAQCGFDHEIDGAGHAAPLGELVGQLPAPEACQRVVAGAAIVLGDLPLRANQLLTLEAVERGIERPLPHLEHAAGPL